MFEFTFRAGLTEQASILDRTQDLTAEEREWSSHFTDQLNGGKVNLSLIPSSSLDVLKLVNDHACEMRDLAKAIELDPVLSGTVLKVANSALFTRSSAAKSIQQAIVSLGLRQVRSLMMTVLMDQALVRGQPFEEFSALTWKHSLFVARLCTMLAKEAGMVEEMGYMAGLFHNVGSIAILSGVRHLNSNSKNEVSPRTCRELMHRRGYTNNARVIQEWKLLQEASDAVGSYRAVPGSRYATPYGMLVSLADALCQKHEIWAEPQQINVDAHPALPLLGLSAAQLPNESQLNHLIDQVENSVDLKS